MIPIEFTAHDESDAPLFEEGLPGGFEEIEREAVADEKTRMIRESPSGSMSDPMTPMGCCLFREERERDTTRPGLRDGGPL